MHPRPLLTKTMNEQAKVLTVQKRYFDKRSDSKSADSPIIVLLRIEHIYQKCEKIGNVLNIALADLITDHRVLEANFLYAGGDTQKDEYSRFEWLTEEQSKPFNNDFNCTLSNLCLHLSPGDLHTVLLTTVAV